MLVTDTRYANALLNAMELDDLALLDPYLHRETMPLRYSMVLAEGPIEHVWFIESGIASIVSNLPDTGPAAVGIFGRDGMSGMAVILGADRSPHETFMQVEGSGFRIETDRLLRAISQSASLQKILLRFVQAMLVQTAQTAISNAHNRIESRLARWLLMCHDRVDGDNIALTHEFMAMMVAAQRTTVTVTLHVLEGAGMIRSQRGMVTILDRDRLVDVAGDAYGKPEAQYNRLVAPILGRPSNVFQIDGSQGQQA